jgi:hypothetical protein
MSDVKDDISYMRKLAEQGRQGSILGGASLAAAGTIFGLTSLVQWGVLSRHLPIPVDQIGNIWLGASALFAVVWGVVFQRVFKAGRTAGNASNTTFAMTWMGCAIGIVVSCAAIGIAAYLTHSLDMLYLVSPVVLAFYGAAWWSVAAVAHRRWMFLASAAAFASTLLLAATSGSLLQLPVMGAALLLTLALPGFKLMTEEAR